MIGRRFFMKRAPAAPMVMDALAKSLTPDAVLGDKVRENAAMVSPYLDAERNNTPRTNQKEGSRLWRIFRRLAKAERDELDKINSRREFSGYCDPNILALRSISPAHKAMMLAREKMAFEERSQAIDRKYKLLSGYTDWLKIKGNEEDDDDL